MAARLKPSVIDGGMPESQCFSRERTASTAVRVVTDLKAAGQRQGWSAYRRIQTGNAELSFFILAADFEGIRTARRFSAAGGVSTRASASWFAPGVRPPRRAAL